MTRTLIPACVAIPMLFLMPAAGAPSDVAIEGELTVWHPLTLTFNGPSARETDNKLNPFLDYRLQVRFTSPAFLTARRKRVLSAFWSSLMTRRSVPLGMPMRIS